MTPPPDDQQSASFIGPNASSNAGRHPVPDQLETIREILVGDRLDSLSSRFRALEQSQEAHYTRIGNDLLTKFEALKVLNKSEIDDLGNSVAEMVGELQKEDHVLTEELRNCKQRLAGLEQRVDAIKTSLDEQIGRMNDELTRKISEFSDLIRTQQEDAARQAVSRTEFSKILSGLAGSLAPDGSSHEE